MKAKKLLALLLAAVFVVSCMTFIIPASAKVTEVGNVYNVPKVTDPITADGVIDTTKEWKGAVEVDLSGNWYGDTGGTAGEAMGWFMTGSTTYEYGEGSKLYVMWDDTNLYLGYNVVDPTIDDNDEFQIRLATNSDNLNESDLTNSTYSILPYDATTKAAKFGMNLGTDNEVLNENVVVVSNQTEESRTNNYVVECVIPHSAIASFLVKAGDTLAAGDCYYIQFRFTNGSGGLGVAAQCNGTSFGAGGAFGGARDTFILDSKACGDVTGNPYPAIKGTETFEVGYASTAPKMDGIVTSSEWEGAAWIDLTEDGIGWLMPKDGYDYGIGDSYGLMLWDETNLYLAFDIRDNLAATYQENEDNDGIQFVMDSAEIKLWPKYGSGAAITGINAESSTIAVKMYDANYVIEATIPWTEINGAPTLINGSKFNLDARVRQFVANETGDGDIQAAYGYSAPTWTGKDTYTLTKPLSSNPNDLKTGTETFKIPYANVLKPTIDGKIDDAEWAGAEYVDLTNLTWYMGGGSLEGAYGLMKWDDDYLYVAFDVRDTTDTSRFTSGTWNDQQDAVDIYTFATGHTNEKKFMLPAKQSDTKSTQLFIPGNAVSTDGSAASVSYGTNYVVEAAIPWSEFENLANADANGDPQNGSTLDLAIRIRDFNAGSLCGWGVAGSQGGVLSEWDTYTLAGKPLAANHPVAKSDDDDAHTFYVPERTTEIKIDGYLADSEWKNAERVSLEYDAVGWLMGAAGYTNFGESYALLQWDTDYLYIAYNIDDPTYSIVEDGGSGDQVGLAIFSETSDNNTFGRFAIVSDSKEQNSVIENNNLLGTSYDVKALMDTTRYGSKYVTEVAIPWTAIAAIKDALVEKGLECTYEAVAGKSLFMNLIIHDWNAETNGWGCGWGFSAGTENGSFNAMNARDEFVLVGAPRLTVEDTEAKAGEEFTVDVNMSFNSGIIALRYKVEFDSDVLELVEVTDKEVLNGLMDLKTELTSPYIIGYEDALADENNEANGVITTLKFKVKDGAEAGSTEVKITPIEAWETVNDFTGKEITFVGSKATITVKEAEHVCTLTHHDKVDPKCEEAGTIEYWSCDCGKLYSDAEGTTEITEEDLPIAATGHSLTKHDRVDPDCQNEGNIEYWSCGNAGCGKYFSDAEGTTEISLDDTVLDKANHDTETKHDDEGHWEECKNCDYASDKTPHTYGDWTVTTAPELGVKGVKTRTCECGHTETADVAALGDVNGTGEVDETDAIVIARYLVGWDVTVNAEADVDGDGRITDWDSIMIQRYLAGWFD